jgi:hypothetical protein
MDWVDRIKERLAMLPGVAQMLDDTLTPEERALDAAVLPCLPA